MIDIRRLAFIGGGNMAAALVGGLTKRGLPGERIVVADPSALQLQRLVRDYGVRCAADNAGAVAGAEVVILAVKPQQMRAVALALSPHLAVSKPLLISVAAGIPHAALARWFGAQIPVVRTMPNRPALNGFGATGLYAPAGVGAANRALAESIMAAVSATVWVEHESQMDTVTALSGSGPPTFSCSWKRSRPPRMSVACPTRLPISSPWRRRLGPHRWRASRPNRLLHCVSR